MLRCKICGCEFNAAAEKYYISRDEVETGVIAAFKSTEECKIYDTFDCPQCGRQNVIQGRRRRVFTENAVKNEDTEA